MIAAPAHRAVEPALRRLADTLPSPLVFASARSFDLMFDERLPATVRLHPDGRSVTVDLWCGDASEVGGAERRILVELLLGLNARHPGDPWRWAGLDSRDFVLVHGRALLSALEGEAFPLWLQSLAREARQVRSLVDPLLA